MLKIPRVFLMTAPHLDQPALPETQFLIEAANLGMVNTGFSRQPENGVIRVLELFEELHRREAEANGLGAPD